jgi:hypothetical protein
MRRRCSQELVEVCGEYDILPSSYIIPGSEVQKQGNFPVSFEGFIDVWKGVYGKERKVVVIKALRQYQTADVQTIKKVKSFDILVVIARSNLTIL